MLRLLFPLRAPQALALCVVGLASAMLHLAQADVDRALSALLVSRFERAAVADWTSVHGIVVAGGSIRRVEEAVRLARQHRHLKILLTGASEQETAAAARARRDLGIDVLIEPAATNTHENAVLSAQMARPGPDERWLLVTTEHHMPRAMGSFHAAGFAVEPWPVPDHIGSGDDLRSVVWHEVGGLATYWLAGRTTALFPGPGLVRDNPIRVAAGTRG